jgi:hypothetical protein
MRATQNCEIVDGHGKAGFFEQLANARIDMYIVRQENIGMKPSFTGTWFAV